MALNPFSLADAFESAWKKQNPNEMIPAKTIAKAVSQFIDTGQTAMMGCSNRHREPINWLSPSKTPGKASGRISFLVAKKETAAIQLGVSMID